MDLRSSFVAVLVAVLPCAVVRAEGLRGELQLDDSVSPSGSHESSEPILVADGDRFFAVWTENGVGASTSRDVYYSYSADGGKSWSAELRIDSQDKTDDDQPSIAVDGSLVVIGWLKGDPQDVYCAVSTDGGQTFNAEFGISGNLEGDVGDADNLRMAVSGQNVYAVFEDDVNDPGNDEDCYAAISINGGATFANPVRVNDSPAGTTDIDNPAIAVTSTHLFVLWIDNRNNDDQPFFSSYNGLVWSTNKRLDSAPAGKDSDSPAIGAEGNKVYCVWLDDRNNSANNLQQVFFARSTNSGASFSADTLLGSTPVGNDADRPRVAAAGNNVYVCWNDNRNGLFDDVFVAASTNSGVNFAAAVAVDSDAGTIESTEPEIVAAGDYVYVTYQHESETAGQHNIFMSYSARNGAVGTYQTLRLSPGIHGNSDADANHIAVNSYRDVVTIWVDDRAGSDNAENDVYVNGQRLPNLTAVVTGNKTQFTLSEACPSDDGRLMFVVFSGTGTSWTPLPGSTGISMHLTIDAFTLVLAQSWALPIFGDTVSAGAANTLPFKFPFSGFALAVLIDTSTLDVVATTDPVGF